MKLNLTGSLIGGYKVTEHLANGGHAEVYLATAAGGAPVVLKALNAKLRPEEPISDVQILWHYDNEVKAYERVRHARLVRLIHHGEEYTPSGENFRYLILEYMPGGHLGTFCRKRGALTLEEVIRYFGPICEALSAMHHNGVIHCDVKPSNLLFDDAENPTTLKLSDLGVAKILTDGYAQDRSLVGTPPYAAPEHNPAAEAEDLTQDVDIRADLYSLATTIYAALTAGKPKLNKGRLVNLPFHPSLGEHRERLSDVLRKAAARRVENRYSSVEEFWDDFKDYKSVRAAIRKDDEEEVETINAESEQIVITVGAPVELETAETATVIRLPDNVSLDIVRVPAGSYQMGTDREEIERLANACPYYLRDYAHAWLNCEHPRHPASVETFWMGTYPVTIKQWRVVATKFPQATMPLEPNPCGGLSDEQPVTSITWEEASEFCLRLSSNVQRKVRLPSEAEWEYACRANSPGMFSFIGPPDPSRVSYSGVWPGESEKMDRPSAKRPPGVGSVGGANPFGLHDMHGGVWEWCADTWRDGYAGAPADGSAWMDARDPLRVARGGSCRSLGISCRSASRISFLCFEKTEDLGFRIVLDGR